MTAIETLAGGERRAGKGRWVRIRLLFVVGVSYGLATTSQAGFRSLIRVGISSDTVGWIGTAHCRV
jgi:hypothetical protein